MSAAPEALAPPQSAPEAAPQAPPAPVTLFEAFLYWLKLGFVSFGGPAGQIAMMHTELVERRRWISEHRFLHALNYTMVLPGPEAQQLATYIGWLMHGPLGGIMAGVLFVLPSLGILIGLTWVYLAYGDVPLVTGILYGIKPAVTAIVVFAAWRIGSRALRNAVLWAMAAAAFVAIFALHVPFPAIVVAAGLIGYIGGHIAPDKFKTGGGHGASNKTYGPALIDDHTPTPEHAGFSWPRTLVYSLAGLALWGLVEGRLARTAHPDGLVLHQGSPGHLRRGLCGAALRLPGRGGNTRLAHGPADDRRTGPGGDHPRSADHGGGFRRLRRQLDQGAVRTRGPSPGRHCRGKRRDLLHLPAVLPVHAGGRPGGGGDAPRHRLHHAAHRDHRRRVGVVINLAVFFAWHVLWPDATDVAPFSGAFEWFSLLITIAAFLALWRYKVGIIPVIAASALAGLAYSLLT